MKYQLRYFPFRPLDYKAAQDYLDRKAAQGWVLEGLFLGCALFQRDPGRRHCVDIYQQFSFGPSKEYLQLCADAGWECVHFKNNMVFLRSKPGADPSPVQSDPAFEWREFLRKHVRQRLLFCGLYLLLMAALTLLERGFGLDYTTPLSALAHNGYLLALAVGALLLPVLVWEVCHTVRYLLRCRAAGELVKMNARSAYLRAALPGLLAAVYLVGICVCNIADPGVDLAWQYYNDHVVTASTATVERCRTYPVVMAADFGLSGSAYRTLTGSRSPLMEVLSYREIAQEADVTVERYECFNEALAKKLAAQRLDETAHGSSSYDFDGLTWQPAGLPGFDESYAAKNGSVLLLRQGSLVVLVGCGDRVRPSPVDLTTPEHLALLQARLEL